MEAVQKTPEREAFYKKIDGENLSALWNVMGDQMVIPGDIAPAHRHSQSALRFVLEGKGSTTAVDGERTAMAPGDFVITPSMTWHDHSNETSEPMFWLDGLDIPMVQFFDASFAEGSNEDQQKITRPAGDSFARYGHNLLPVDS